VSAASFWMKLRTSASVHKSAPVGPGLENAELVTMSSSTAVCPGATVPSSQMIEYELAVVGPVPL
jgi:hypothetical protein